MTYIELINEFWEQDRVDPMPPIDTKFYLYLLDECNRRRWINPFELQSRITELRLMITRKTIGEVRNRLKQRGLIDFVASRNKSTVYRILHTEDSEGNCFSDCFPQVTIRKLSGLQFGNNYGYNSETHIKDIRYKTDKREDFVVDNNISFLRTREEIELEKFDSLIQEVVDGKHQIWEDEIRKKFRIDSVIDYLPSFRSHAIACAEVGSISNHQEFRKYFVNSFHYFTKQNPIQLLAQYSDSSKSEEFVKYCDWVREKAPNVASRILPLTEVELKKLTDFYGKKQVFTAILDINNREDLVGRYFALYWTLIKWLEK